MSTHAERIFVGRSHVARVAEARLEQINRYCQVRIYLTEHLIVAIACHDMYYKQLVSIRRKLA